MSTISANELGGAIIRLRHMKQITPWYKPLIKFRLDVMIETLLGVVDWISNQRSCGCAAHTNQHTN